jgi:hypothetical protein
MTFVPEAAIASEVPNMGIRFTISSRIVTYTQSLPVYCVYPSPPSCSGGKTL